MPDVPEDHRSQEVGANRERRAASGVIDRTSCTRRSSPSGDTPRVPRVKPGIVQRLVALFILLATLGCTVWAVVGRQDYPAAAVLLVGGLFLSARLGGALGRN